MKPGEVICDQSEIELNAGSDRLSLDVSNSGDRPIQVGSHFHFFEVNRALQFDRQRAYGRRLDVPSGSAVRFEPGQKHTVELVPIKGRRIVYGFNGLVNGQLFDPEVKKTAEERLRSFLNDERG